MKIKLSYKDWKRIGKEARWGTPEHELLEEQGVPYSLSQIYPDQKAYEYEWTFDNGQKRKTGTKTIWCFSAGDALKIIQGWSRGDFSYRLTGVVEQR